MVPKDTLEPSTLVVSFEFLVAKFGVTAQIPRDDFVLLVLEVINERACFEPSSCQMIIIYAITI